MLLTGRQWDELSSIQWFLSFWSIIVAFLLAYMVTSGIKGQNFFRAGFFIPNLIGGIVLGYVWKFVFNRAIVAIGQALSVGALSTSWLSTTNGAMFCLILVSVWQYAGYMMLIYVAGFMSVSKSLMEAAEIDGCTKTQATINVTIPLMRSSFVQCLSPYDHKMLHGLRCKPFSYKRRAVQLFRYGGYACLQSGVCL